MIISPFADTLKENFYSPKPITTTRLISEGKYQNAAGATKETQWLSSCSIFPGSDEQFSCQHNVKDTVVITLQEFCCHFTEYLAGASASGFHGRCVLGIPRLSPSRESPQHPSMWLPSSSCLGKPEFHTSQFASLEVQ